MTDRRVGGGGPGGAVGVGGAAGSGGAVGAGGATDEVGPELRTLAELWGVQPSYRGAGEGIHAASAPALLHALRALGAPVSGPDDVDDALRARSLEVGTRLLEPASVQWRDGGPPTISLRISAGARTARCRLELEEGEVREWEVAVDELADHGGERVEGRSFRVRRLPLPPELPDGVHRLVVEAGGAEGAQWVIRAPRRAFPGAGATPERPAGVGPGTPAGNGPSRDGRAWGVFLPLYALRTERSWGTADLTDLRSLGEWVAGLGGRIVATLPLLAAHLGEAPFDPSPYAPVSRLFWNELYVDVEPAPELASAPEARRVLESSELRDAVARLRGADRVDYRAAVRWKHRALQPLADAVVGDDPRGHDGLRGWLERRPEALAYARFRGVGARRGSGWRTWPGHLRDAGSEPGRIDPDALDADAFRLHLYAQWLADRQLAAAAEDGAAGLHLDLPLGTHPDGFDTWRHPGLFATGVTGGAPPDAFFEGGQDWGFPPLHPEALRSDGYGYWRAALRTQLRHTALLRVDHVMGLHRLFWVPREMGPGEGVYVRYPAEELWALLCLESRRHRTEIVGEDLGTVPPEVREAMDRHGVRRMYVVPFELRETDEDDSPEEGVAPEATGAAGAALASGRDGAGRGGAAEPALEPVPANALAALGTHDLPPFAAFWRERRRGAEGGNAAGHDRGSAAGEAGVRDTLQGLLARLARSPARWLLVSLEDLWLETEPQNVPGPGAEGGSWRRKARHTLEEIRRMSEVEEILREVDRLRREGRADAASRADATTDVHETPIAGEG